MQSRILNLITRRKAKESLSQLTTFASLLPWRNQAAQSRPLKVYLFGLPEEGLVVSVKGETRRFGVFAH